MKVPFIFSVCIQSIGNPISSTGISGWINNPKEEAIVTDKNAKASQRDEETTPSTSGMRDKCSDQGKLDELQEKLEERTEEVHETRYGTLVFLRERGWIGGL